MKSGASNHDWDVVIVGGGGSGLAAAVAASGAGARTLLLEKRDELGGTTRLAVGSISAPGTRLQRRKGIVDTPEAFVQDSQAFTGDLLQRDDLKTRQMLANQASETVRFLEELGIAFVGPFPEPPHRVPRMLNVVPGARAYIGALTSEARRLGVNIRTGFRVTELIVEDTGVVGLRGYDVDGIQDIRTKKGVILAAGDYSASPELRATHIREEARDVAAVNPMSTGDGHVLGSQAGGELVNMDITDGPQLRFPPPGKPTMLDRLPAHRMLARTLAAIGNRLPPPILRRFAKQLLTAWMAPSAEFIESGPVLVDIDGRLVTDAGDGLAYAVSRRPQQLSYLILSDQVAGESETAGRYISTAPGIAYAYWRDYQRGRPDLVVSDRTVAGLARRLDMSPEKLHESINSTDSRPHFESGLYHSIGPLRSLFVTTEGGLRVNDECRVVRPNGHPIEGLWAAGSNGQSGLVLSGHGVHILWAITSGRIAGMHAAKGDAVT